MPQRKLAQAEEDLITAHRIKDQVLAAAEGRVSRIVFHGSRATGKPHRSSDFDILVVVHDPVEDWVAESMRFTDLFNDFPWPVDVQVYGEADFDASSTVPGTLAHPASTRGVILHEA